MKWGFLVAALLCVTQFARWSPQHPLPCDPAKNAAPQMVQIKNFKSAWQIQRGCGFPDAKDVGFVVELFYERWERKFGDEEGKVLKVLDRLMIEWGKEPKVLPSAAFDVNGKPLAGKAKGITLLPGYIWVWEEKYKRIAATALVHELVHSALWAKSGLHGDPDHEGSEFEGWTPSHSKFIREINRLLAKIDI